MLWNTLTMKSKGDRLWHAMTSTKNHNHVHNYAYRCFLQTKHTHIHTHTDQIENSVGVSCELGHLSEGWIFPHQDLVLRIAMGAYLEDEEKETSSAL